MRVHGGIPCISHGERRAASTAGADRVSMRPGRAWAYDGVRVRSGIPTIGNVSKVQEVDCRCLRSHALQRAWHLRRMGLCCATHASGTRGPSVSNQYSIWGCKVTLNCLRFRALSVYTLSFCDGIHNRKCEIITLTPNGATFSEVVFLDDSL